MEMDHVAVVVSDVPSAVEWYKAALDAEVLYADPTWAFLRVGQGKLALVTASQHPPHVAVRVNETRLHELATIHKVAIDKHRDGTQGFYYADPDGNVIEVICYPPGQTIYER